MCNMDLYGKALYVAIGFIAFFCFHVYLALTLGPKNYEEGKAGESDYKSLCALGYIVAAFWPFTIMILIVYHCFCFINNFAKNINTITRKLAKVLKEEEKE